MLHVYYQITWPYSESRNFKNKHSPLSNLDTTMYLERKLQKQNKTILLEMSHSLILQRSRDITEIIYWTSAWNIPQ